MWVSLYFAKTGGCEWSIKLPVCAPFFLLMWSVGTSGEVEVWLVAWKKGRRFLWNSVCEGLAYALLMVMSSVAGRDRGHHLAWMSGSIFSITACSSLGSHYFLVLQDLALPVCVHVCGCMCVYRCVCVQMCVFADVCVFAFQLHEWLDRFFTPRCFDNEIYIKSF